MPVETIAEGELARAFAEGVDDRWDGCRRYPVCSLAEYDPDGRPCEGKLERFHYLGRQRVGNALYALLLRQLPPTDVWDVIKVAEWDSRNGGHACEAHHRRYDRQMTPVLVLPRAAIPRHVRDFVNDYGLESEANDKWPS